jgi:hypothetical protein
VWIAGGDVEESRAEDDKDHTISSSSSESESLAHLVLGEVGESMSSDDEGDIDKEVKEVDMMMCLLIGGERHHDGRPGAIYYILQRRWTGGGDEMMTISLFGFRLSDPPIDQTSPKSSNRDLFDLYASSPHSPLRISHQFSPALLQHDPIPLYRFQYCWHRDARAFPVANLIVVIGTPCEQVPPAPTRSCT